MCSQCLSLTCPSFIVQHRPQSKRLANVYSYMGSSKSEQNDRYRYSFENVLTNVINKIVSFCKCCVNSGMCAPSWPRVRLDMCLYDVRERTKRWNYIWRSDGWAKRKTLTCVSFPFGYAVDVCSYELLIFLFCFCSSETTCECELWNIPVTNKYCHSHWPIIALCSCWFSCSLSLSLWALSVVRDTI